MKTKMVFLKLTLISFIFLCSAHAFAQNESMQDIINQGIHDSNAAMKKLLINSNNLNEEKKAAKKAEEKARKFHGEAKAVHTKYLSDLRRLKSGMKNQQQSIQPIGACAVFVSFSMPEPSLKQIIADADRYQVPVVLRGLYKNSLKETANKILALTKENNKGGILINPVWFRKYDIKVVPAFLVADFLVTEKGIRNDTNFDLVYGNIPLKRALTLISEKGKYAKESLAVLARGER